MPDPTLRLTFDDLRLRVAEFLGCAYYGAGGDEQAQVPTDAHDLEMCSRIVNDGYRRFLTDNPRGWNFMTVPFSLTFGANLVDPADNSRYLLPDDFYGILLEPFTYTTGGSGISVRPMPESAIRELVAGGATSGTPSVFAVRPINTDETSDGGRWEAIFWPTPAGEEVVTAVYKRFPAALTTGTDVPVSGFQHDRTVLAACIAEAEVQRGDNQGPREQNYQTCLARSLVMDARATPIRNVGYGDKSEDYSSLGGRPLNYYGVTTYNGVPIE